MASARKKKPRGQPNLTAERVRDEALRLIEKDGLEAFSTRKLGRALGVEAMAIYWYYPSKDALLDAVVETLVGKLGDAVPGAARHEGPVDFIDALRKLAHAYRGLAHAYPAAFPLLATRRFATKATYHFLDDVFGLAEEHGLDARTTARFYRLLASYCNGVALDELAGLREGRTRTDPTEGRAALPRVARVWEWLTPERFDDVFSFGLEVLLGALREETSRPPSANATKIGPARPATRSRASRDAR